MEVASRVLSDPPAVLSPFLGETNKIWRKTNKIKPKRPRVWKPGSTGCQSQLYCFPVVGPGTSHIPSLSPSFIVCGTWFLPPPPPMGLLRDLGAPQCGEGAWAIAAPSLHPLPDIHSETFKGAPGESVGSAGQRTDLRGM